MALKPSTPHEPTPQTREESQAEWDAVLFEGDDFPYCECGLEPTEDEEMDNVCDACGKPHD